MQTNSETTMNKLTRDDLWSLEEYAQKRNEFRAQVMAHKKNRQVHVGPHATLYFEDRMVMQYQVQEMLRVERIFEAEGIQEELDTYNPLIPDGCNWKATFMIEYDDENERREALAAEPDRVREILGDGAQRARRKASGVLRRAQEACGVRRPS